MMNEVECDMSAEEIKRNEKLFRDLEDDFGLKVKELKKLGYCKHHINDLVNVYYTKTKGVVNNG